MTWEFAVDNIRGSGRGDFRITSTGQERSEGYMSDLLQLCKKKGNIAPGMPCLYQALSSNQAKYARS